MYTFISEKAMAPQSSTIAWKILENPMDGGAWWAAGHDRRDLAAIASSFYTGFPGGSSGERTGWPIQETKETQVQSLAWEDPLVEGVGTPSSILAWRIPWTEEPGGLLYTGSQKAGYN